MGAVEFNPTAKPGVADYGLLYTSGSDLGFSNGGGPNASNPGADPAARLGDHARSCASIRGSPSVTERHQGPGRLHDSAVEPSSPPTTIRRRSARSTPTASATRTACRGTRWTARCSRSDIGMDQIEEVNIVRNGGNYGWMKREGYFENGVSRPGGTLDSAVPAAGRRAERPDEGRVHLPGGDLRPPRRPGRVRRLRLLRHAFRRCAASSCSATSQRGRALRRRRGGDEEGRRRHSADRGAGGGDPALRARQPAASASTCRCAS